MQLPRRSFAYSWAKSTLNRQPPSWAPLLGIAVAGFATVLWLSEDRRPASLLVVAVCALLGTLEAWHLRGMREIFAEQQRMLEESRQQRNA